VVACFCGPLNFCQGAKGCSPTWQIIAPIKLPPALTKFTHGLTQTNNFALMIEVAARAGKIWVGRGKE
jgi:ABC-type proline/glycine betaine transport system permease subunit